MNFTRVTAILAVIFVAVSWWIIATPASDFLPEATNHAVDIDFLFKFMLVASVAVFLIVEGYMVYFIARYRHRAGEPANKLGADIHGNTRLEIIWSAIPAIFLVVLTALSFKVYLQIIAPQSGEYAIKAIARQFSWECDSEQYTGIKELGTCHMPVNTKVRIDLDALDVIHSFWVPEFRVKQDAVPGYPTRMHFTTTRAGVYHLICSELCGAGHSQMTAVLSVCPITAAQAARIDACSVGNAHNLTFAQWVTAYQKQQSGTGAAPSANLSFSKDIETIFASHCLSCHGAAGLGGLHLSSYQGLVAGGSLVPGPIFKAGDSKNSLIIKMIGPTGPYPGGNRMPLGGPYLSPNLISTIAAWIDQGAKNN